MRRRCMSMSSDSAYSSPTPLTPLKNNKFPVRSKQSNVSNKKSIFFKVNCIQRSQNQPVDVNEYIEESPEEHELKPSFSRSRRLASTSSEAPLLLRSVNDQCALETTKLGKEPPTEPRKSEDESVSVLTKPISSPSRSFHSNRPVVVHKKHRHQRQQNSKTATPAAVVVDTTAATPSSLQSKCDKNVSFIGETSEPPPPLPPKISDAPRPPPPVPAPKSPTGSCCTTEEDKDNMAGVSSAKMTKPVELPPLPPKPVPGELMIASSKKQTKKNGKMRNIPASGRGSNDNDESERKLQNKMKDAMTKTKNGKTTEVRQEMGVRGDQGHGLKAVNGGIERSVSDERYCIPGDEPATSMNTL